MSGCSKRVLQHYLLTMVPILLLFGMFNIGYSRNIKVDSIVKEAINIDRNLGDPTDTLTCMQKIIPCKQFFTSPMIPPSICCDPVKEIVTKDIKCLCDLFNNVDLLKQFNVTQQIAVKLTTACGATIDLNVCNKDAGAPAAAPATISSTPPTTNSTTPDSSSSNSPTDNNSKKSAAIRWMSPFGGSSFGFVACFLTLNIVAAFF